MNADDRQDGVWLDFLELMKAAGVTFGESVNCDVELSVSGVTSDSRKVRPGDVFVALQGVRSDGRAFVDDAIQAGARVVVSESAAASVDRVADMKGVAGIRVHDAHTALARLAAAFEGFGAGGPHAGMKLVGVTGTNGKSTTAILLRTILQAADHPTALLGTIGYDLLGEHVVAQWTTPPPVVLYHYLAKASQRGATHAVMEVSSHALAQSRCDGHRFSVGIFTNLTGDHLDYHGTPEAYLAAKRRLFESLDDQATAMVNADDPSSIAMVEGCRAKVLRFGLGDRAEFRAENVRYSIEGTRFRLFTPAGAIDISMKLCGAYNVSNALAAAGAAETLGVSLDQIRRGLEGIGRVPGRLERVDAGSLKFHVFVDFAHTDDALVNVLSTLRPLTQNRLICVFGCGGNRDESKRPRMARAVERFCDLAILTSDNPRKEDPDKIIADIATGFSDIAECTVRVEPDRRRAIGEAIAMATPGDTVLIAGKGHEDYQIVGDQQLPFDDAEEVRIHLQRITRNTSHCGVDG